MPPTHYEEAWQALNEGLRLASNGQAPKAVDALFYAATQFERNQEFRLIPAVWEAIGELLQIIRNTECGGIPDTPELMSEEKRKFLLNYRVISEQTWREFSDKHFHRLAWVYQWAAEHKERANDSDTAQKLYFMAADYAEQTEEVKQERPQWAARLYHRAVLNHIRFFGTATVSEPSEGKTILGPLKRRVKGTSGKHTGDPDCALEKMLYHFGRLANQFKKPAKAYKQLAMAYSSLKSALIDSGNLIEARQMEEQELCAARKYHYSAGNLGQYFYYWMRTGGFQIFLLA